jgi:hypothetical protein
VNVLVPREILVKWRVWLECLARSVVIENTSSKCTSGRDEVVQQLPSLVKLSYVYVSRGLVCSLVSSTSADQDAVYLTAR